MSLNKRTDLWTLLPSHQTCRFPTQYTLHTPSPPHPEESLLLHGLTLFRASDLRTEQANGKLSRRPEENVGFRFAPTIFWCQCGVCGHGLSYTHTHTHIHKHPGTWYYKQAWKLKTTQHCPHPPHTHAHTHTPALASVKLLHYSGPKISL